MVKHTVYFSLYTDYYILAQSARALPRPQGTSSSLLRRARNGSTYTDWRHHAAAHRRVRTPGAHLEQSLIDFVYLINTDCVFMDVNVCWWLLNNLEFHLESFFYSLTCVCDKGHHGNNRQKKPTTTIAFIHPYRSQLATKTVESVLSIHNNAALRETITFSLSHWKHIANDNKSEL